VLHHAEHPNAIMRLNPLHFAFAGIYHQAVLGLLEPVEYGGRFVVRWIICVMYGPIALSCSTITQKFNPERAFVREQGQCGWEPCCDVRCGGTGGTALRGYNTRRDGHRPGYVLVGTSSGWVGPAMGNNKLSSVLGQRREPCVWEPCMGENPVERKHAEVHQSGRFMPQMATISQNRPI